MDRNAVGLLHMLQFCKGVPFCLVAMATLNFKKGIFCDNYSKTAEAV